MGDSIERCRCPACCDDPMDTWTPEYMHRCLVLSLAQRESDDIRARLAMMASRHGDDYAAALRMEVEMERINAEKAPLAGGDDAGDGLSTTDREEIE